MKKTGGTPAKPKFRTARAAVIGLASLSLTACEGKHDTTQPREAVKLSSHDLQIATEVDSCRETIARVDRSVDTGLDPARLSLLSWNVQKGWAPQWNSDLEAIGSGRDLILLQEATADRAPDEFLDGMHHWAFAPGYRDGEKLSGVVTLSSSPPLSHCNLTNVEPWLKTPKATAITEYGLAGTSQTLVVVNIHAVNLSLGLEEFRDQMEQIGEVLEDHEGPVILSGDLNTWRSARQVIVDDLAARLSLTAVHFEEDHRMRFLGYALDHIYVRGLNLSASNTYELHSSDHNPITADLSIYAPRGTQVAQNSGSQAAARTSSLN